MGEDARWEERGCGCEWACGCEVASSVRTLDKRKGEQAPSPRSPRSTQA